MLLLKIYLILIQVILKTFLLKLNIIRALRPGGEGRHEQELALSLALACGLVITDLTQPAQARLLNRSSECRIV